MSKNFYQKYEEGSARDRAKLIFNHYCSFKGIIEDCEARLIYEIKSEEQFSRSHNRDELGVRIQNLGHHSDPTANEAVSNVLLKESVNGNGQIELNGQVSLDVKLRLERKHHILIVMKEEYNVFDKHLYSLMPEDQKIIIPLLMHSKDYYEIAKDFGQSIECIRKRASRIRRSFIEDITSYFVEKI